MAESSCLINLSQNIKIVKSEYLKYWEEFSHWWGQWQEDGMRNKWNGIRRKRLTIARTDPKLASRSSNWQFGLAGMQNFYQNKTNVSSQVHSSCVLDNLCWPTLCASMYVRCSGPRNCIPFCSSNLQFFIELQYWFTSKSHTVPSCTIAF